MTVHVNVNTSLQEFTLQNQAGQSKAEHVIFGKDFKLNCHVTCFGPLGIFFFSVTSVTGMLVMKKTYQGSR